MEIEQTIRTFRCDNCDAEYEDEKSLPVKREGMVWRLACGGYVIDASPWKDFCNEECAMQFLKKHQGIRWMYDDEDCPVEFDEFNMWNCPKCPYFNDRLKLCEIRDYSDVTIIFENVIPMGAFE